jgi:hypothetical protein
MHNSLIALDKYLTHGGAMQVAMGAGMSAEDAAAATATAWVDAGGAAFCAKGADVASNGFDMAFDATTGQFVGTPCCMAGGNFVIPDLATDLTAAGCLFGMPGFVNPRNLYPDNYDGTEKEYDVSRERSEQKTKREREWDAPAGRK